MGSAQSYLSSDAIIATAIVAGAVGVGLGYSQRTKVIPATTTTSTSKKGKKKGKNQVNPTTPSNVVPFPAVIPGQFDVEPSPPHSSNLSNSLKDQKAKSTSNSYAAAAAKPAPEQSVAPDTTKSKKSKKKKGKTAGESLVSSTASVGLKGDESSSSASLDREVTQKPKAKQQKSVQSQDKSQAQTQKQPQNEKQPESLAQVKTSSLTRSLKQSTTSIDTDDSWTRVEKRRRTGERDALAMSVSSTTDDTGRGSSTSSPLAERAEGELGLGGSFDTIAGDPSLDDSATPHERRRTFAEKMLPKPRKTAVDDMLEASDRPTIARVMRVRPNPGERPASGFSWGDYEDVQVGDGGGGGESKGPEEDDDEDGWGMVRSKRPKADRSAAAQQQRQQSQVQVQRAPESLTKKQRQNAQKREAQKAEKQAAETERLNQLAKHKRELERTRTLEQLSGGKSGGKTPSGGMKATVDERGKLVWE